MPLPPRTDSGYDVVAAAKSAPPGVNGYLSHPELGEQRLWVYEIQTGFGLSGQTGQSFRTRSFFPRNFKQPSFTIMCQFPNQALYGNVTEYIRRVQRRLDSSLRMEIIPRTTYNGRMLKGTSQVIAAEGYIKRVPREHQRFVYAPELAFDFIVERMILPKEWSDERTTMRKLLSWNDVIARRANTFAQDPDPVPELQSRPPVSAGPNGELRPN